GGWQIGVEAAQRGALWVDRPFARGRPRAEWLIARCREITQHGGYTQVLNEPNLPLEEWPGDAADYRDYYASLLYAYPEGNWIAGPPSPGVPGWQDWVVRGAKRLAVHCYGDLGNMQQVVRWCLENTSADLWIT